jgi:L-lactate dehydrogenase complex protein LldE
MKVGLFIPCYVDQLKPEVGLATVRLLEQAGCEVEFPEDQTCCGQPMANAGSARAAAKLLDRLVRIFSRFDHVVAPSASCVSMVRNHAADYLGHRADLEALRPRVFELCEFLHDVVGARSFPAKFPHRVGLHPGCHGLRELRLGRSSELRVPAFDKVRTLLCAVEGLTLVEPSRPDECCGFGGTFALAEHAVSGRMGRDRVGDHAAAGAEVITSTDVSCLLQLEGIARRTGSPVRTLHVAEILAGVAS